MCVCVCLVTHTLSLSFVCTDGGGGGGRGGGGEESLYKADAVNEEDPEHVRARRKKVLRRSKWCKVYSKLTQ